MAFKMKPADLILYVFLAYAVLTFLNLVISRVFPQVPVVQTGYFLILLFVSVYLVLLFAVFYDKTIEKIEILTIIIVAASFVGAFFALKKFVPELFSILNNFSGGAFSILG